MDLMVYEMMFIVYFWDEVFEGNSVCDFEEERDQEVVR